MRAVSLIWLMLVLPGQAADKRSVTVDDLMKIRNVGEIRVTPDGSAVAYVLTVLDEEKNKYDSDIWLVNVKDKKTTQLTRAPGRDDTPRWSPDGKTLAFLSDRSGKAQVWLLPRDGGEPRKLTDHVTAVSDMAWSPDGKTLAFLAADPETEQEKAFKKDRGDVVVMEQEVKMTHLHQ